MQYTITVNMADDTDDALATVLIFDAATAVAVALADDISCTVALESENGPVETWDLRA